MGVITLFTDNHTHSKMWDEIIYPFLNFNACTDEVWEWIK